MIRSQLLARAAEVFAQPVRLAVYGLSVASLVAGLSAGSAMAQQQWSTPVRPEQMPAPNCCGGAPGAAIGDGTTPLPTPIEPGDDASVPTPDPETAVPTPGSELPDVGSLSGDTGFASAGQSAAPAMIGDSLSLGSRLTLIDGGFLSSGNLYFNGGSKFKAAVNHSAIPVNRVFYQLNHHVGALDFEDTGGSIDGDITRHLFGFEKILDPCGCTSVQVRIPFIDTLSDNVDNGNIPPIPTDVRFGNISVALKKVISQTSCRTVSAGVNLEIPTFDDTFVATGSGNDFIFENEAFTLTPFLAFFDSVGFCIGDWTQGFVSVDLPLNSNTIDANGGMTVVDVDELTVLNLDWAIGKWLSQDCCGNGVAAAVELHYQTALSDGETYNLGGDTLIQEELDVLNLTVGAHIFRGCWRVSPAYVTPISGDQLFDWEFALHANRRF